MRTVSRVHTPEERAEMRRMGEMRCLRSQWRLLTCVSILRTAVTRVLPLCGAAGWWVVLLCLAPQVGLYALGRWGLKRSGKACLQGSRLACLAAGACLLVESISCMTALVTLFTEGVGTPGTAFTLALVAAGMALFAMNREGLARGVYLVRWLLLAAVALVLAGYAAKARVDHLFPLLGGGWTDVRRALAAGAGMGWPMLLGLMEMPIRRTDVLPPVALGLAGPVCLCLCIPHEVIITHQTLGDTLVQTVAHLSPFGRLVGICLWMSGLFLSIASGCSLGAAHCLAPWGRELPWLAGVLALGMAAVQLVDTRTLWQALALAEPWLLLGLALCAALCWRKK